jgi:hypothetical protein
MAPRVAARARRVPRGGRRAVRAARLDPGEIAGAALRLRVRGD